MLHYLPHHCTHNSSLFLILAFYIPPKIEQSTNHGGTFIFKGDDLIFAHYDESPGTHYEPSTSVDMAIREATR